MARWFFPAVVGLWFAGLYLSVYLPPGFRLAPLFMVLVGFGGWWGLTKADAKLVPKRFGLGFFLLAIVSAGLLRIQMAAYESPASIATWPRGYYRMEGQVQGYPSGYPGGRQRLFLNVKHARDASGQVNASGKILLYVGPGVPVQRGARLRVAGYLNADLETVKPGWSVWLRHQGVDAIVWAEQLKILAPAWSVESQ
jgi:hypothetical protein